MRRAEALCVSLAAAVIALLIAADCDAPDWQQYAMLLALPPVAGIGLGYAVWGASTRRAVLAVALALAAAAVVELAVVFAWAGECSR